MIFPKMALMENQIDELLILFLSYPVFNNILVLHNTKKRIRVIALTFGNTAIEKNI